MLRRVIWLLAVTCLAQGKYDSIEADDYWNYLPTQGGYPLPESNHVQNRGEDNIQRPQGSPTYDQKNNTQGPSNLEGTAGIFDAERQQYEASQGRPSGRMQYDPNYYDPQLAYGGYPHRAAEESYYGVSRGAYGNEPTGYGDLERSGAVSPPINLELPQQSGLDNPGNKVQFVKFGEEGPNVNDEGVYNDRIVRSLGNIGTPTVPDPRWIQLLQLIGVLKLSPNEWSNPPQSKNVPLAPSQNQPQVPTTAPPNQLPANSDQPAQPSTPPQPNGNANGAPPNYVQSCPFPGARALPCPPFLPQPYLPLGPYPPVFLPPGSYPAPPFFSGAFNDLGNVPNPQNIPGNSPIPSIPFPFRRNNLDILVPNPLIKNPVNPPLAQVALSLGNQPNLQIPNRPNSLFYPNLISQPSVNPIDGLGANVGWVEEPSQLWNSGIPSLNNLDGPLPREGFSPFSGPSEQMMNMPPCCSPRICFPKRNNRTQDLPPFRIPRCPEDTTVNEKRSTDDAADAQIIIDQLNGTDDKKPEDSNDINENNSRKSTSSSEESIENVPK